MKILVAEDDRIVSDNVSSALISEGHNVETVFDGVSADIALKQNEFDALILDLGLPRLDGTVIIERLRKRNSDIPILVISARDSYSDRIKGLDLGADDYLIKPFNSLELLARTRALLRRRYFKMKSEISLGRLRFSGHKRRVYIGDINIKLSAREYSILDLLIRNLGRVISKESILNHISNGNDEICFNAIEVYVSRLRKRIEESGIELKTIRGLGYVLEA